MSIVNVRATELLADVFVAGTPRPAGGLRIGRRKDGSRFLAPNSSAKLGKWTKAIVAALEDDFGKRPASLAPITLDLTFYLVRPKSHFTKKGLRPEAPAYPTARASTNGGGDFDKLTRCVADAITKAAVYGDDSQVVTARVRKRYADEHVEGVHIIVAAILDEAEYMYEMLGETP